MLIGRLRIACILHISRVKCNQIFTFTQGQSYKQLNVIGPTYKEIRIAIFIGLALCESANVAIHYTCHMYCTMHTVLSLYVGLSLSLSLSLCYTTLYHLSPQHHPHHDNKHFHAVNQSHPSEITAAQMASVTTTTPLLTTALPLLCSPTAQ